MKLPSLVSSALCLLFVISASAQNLPADHPTSAIVKKYLTAVVEQDWKATADMLLPASLEKRKLQMVDAIRKSTTMTEEAAKLNMLGIKDIADLEKMPPADAYILDRKAVHERLKVPAEVLLKKKETLKINVLGLVPESEGKIVHALIRTSQETGPTSIEELLLISLAQDKADSKKWYIVPDMQQPIATPIKENAAAARP